MLRLRFIVSLLLTIAITLGYFYYVAQAICPVPITYEVGELDERFGLTLDDAKLAIAEAESVWEDATGQNLFTYEENADLTINFLYDERQALTDAEMAERNRLNTTANVNDQLQSRYDELIARYNDRQVAHERTVAAYEADLAAFNEQVAEYNETGGAPPEVFEELETKREALDATRAAINQEAEALNELVAEINRLSEEGNELITSYNQQVEQYNDTFSTHREFTQGTYRSTGNIDIYTFADREELVLVLAHELGHALSIEHVAGTESVMYFMIGEQPANLELSESDIAAFADVCGARTFWDTINLGFTTSFN